MSAMYLQNKYTNWYKSIIANAQLTESGGYTESHHIIPKCLGGTNDKSNLVRLSGREHFVCHLLLTKMTTGKEKGKMVFALNSMMNRYNNTMDRYVPSSRVYEFLRRQLSEAHKQLGRTVEHKAAISLAHTGKIVSKETRNKMSESSKNNIAGAAVKGSVRSESTKLKISQSRKGIVFSESHKQKLSEAAKNRKKRGN